MQTQESTNPYRAELMQTIQRCAEAFHAVMAKMPKDPNKWDREEFQTKGYLAFCSHLPVLIDPASFQIYFACISQGASIGAIDSADAGRLCHIANSAIAAWKLVNLVIPEAEEKHRLAKKKEQEDDERRARESEKAANPLPSRGNHSDPLSNLQVEMALQQAIDDLPRFEEQKKYFQILRRRGHLLPCDGELRDNPLAALHFVRQGRQVVDDETRAEIAKYAKPAPATAEAQPAHPTQAA